MVGDVKWGSYTADGSPRPQPGVGAEAGEGRSFRDRGRVLRGECQGLLIKKRGFRRGAAGHCLDKVVSRRP